MTAAVAATGTAGATGAYGGAGFTGGGGGGGGAAGLLGSIELTPSRRRLGAPGNDFDFVLLQPTLVLAAARAARGLGFGLHDERHRGRDRGPSVARGAAFPDRKTPQGLFLEGAEAVGERVAGHLDRLARGLFEPSDAGLAGEVRGIEAGEHHDDGRHVGEADGDRRPDREAPARPLGAAGPPGRDPAGEPGRGRGLREIA